MNRLEPSSKGHLVNYCILNLTSCTYHCCSTISLIGLTHFYMNLICGRRCEGRCSFGCVFKLNLPTLTHKKLESQTLGT